MNRRSESMTYREAYDRGREKLGLAGVEEADLEARILLEFVCGTTRNVLLAHGDRLLDIGQQEKYDMLIDRRKTRIPLQYLTGVQEFMGLTFTVNEQVLIPRQDTEILVEEALRSLHDGMRVLDMCTGSGCILISLLHYSNHCQGVGADLSAEALAVAEENAEHLLGLESAAELNGGYGSDIREPGGIRFVQSDLFEKISGKFDMIVSNPPYICSDVIGTLMPEIREHEPILALDRGGDGLNFYRKIAAESREYLYGGGMLFLEIGYDQGEAVSTLLQEAGFLEVQVVKDYAGLDRVVYGTRCFDETVSDKE